MQHFTPETIFLVVGLFGVFACLERIPDLRNKPKWALAFFLIGLATQVSTQILQYATAVGYHNRADRADEREVAFALYALAERNVSLLKKVARNHPYVVGYALYKNGDHSESIGYFENSIKSATFVASSHYMLAQVILQDANPNLKFAKDHLNAAIAADIGYAPAYYARAIVEVKENTLPPALEDLRNAVKYGVGQCGDLQDQEEVRNVWQSISGMPEFEQIKRQCAADYSMTSP